MINLNYEINDLEIEESSVTKVKKVMKNNQKNKNIYLSLI